MTPLRSKLNATAPGLAMVPPRLFVAMRISEADPVFIICHDIDDDAHATMPYSLIGHFGISRPGRRWKLF